MLRIMHAFTTIMFFLCGVIVQHDCLASPLANCSTSKLKKASSIYSNQQDTDDEAINGITSKRILIIDSSECVKLNPSRILSLTDSTLALRDAVFNITYNYDIPIKNNSAVTLTIDSITLSGSLTDFILDTNYKKIIEPGQSTNIRITFLHNTAGDVECVFTIHTNFNSLSSGSNDSNANPTFFLKGKVIKGELVISRSECNIFYLNTINDSCECKNVITFSNKGMANITVDSIVFIGDSADFILVPNDLKERRILGPNQTFELQVIPKPQSKNARSYVGKLEIYSNNRDLLKPIDVSYQSVLPSIIITSPSSFILDADTSLSIPILISRINFPPGDQFRVLSYFRLNLPLESRHAIYNANFTINERISPKDTTQVIDKLTASPNHDSERFFEIKRKREEFNSFEDILGLLSFQYFLSEHDTINILINELTITYPESEKNICYSSFSITNFPISIQKRKDTFCLDPFNTFFEDFIDNIRKNTNDFIASMRVSGEPVMEIQHFLKEATYAQISLYSINGMKLETVFSGIAPAELHQFRHPMSHLPPGVYFCEMVAGQFRKTIPIILNR
ncbi:MAG: hypothetical protein ACKO5I_04685 [Ignavibacteria bacterium]